MEVKRRREMDHALLGVKSFGGLKYRFMEVHDQDEGAFREELLELNAQQLSSLGKIAEIEGSEKSDLVNGIVHKVMEAAKSLPDMDKEEEEMQKKKAGKVPPKRVANPAPAVPANKQPYIDPEIKAIMVRPNSEQYQSLKKSIKKKGLLGTIEVLPDGRIIDGHTRFDIMTELKMPIPEDKIRVLDLSPDEISDYIMNLNVERRHLTDLQRLEYIAKMRPEELKKIDKEEKEKRLAKISETRAIIKKEGKGEAPKKEGKGEAPKKEVPKITKGGGALSRKAGLAGVSVAQQKQYEYVKRYAPRLLEEQIKKLGDKARVGTIWSQVDGWMKYVKERDPESHKLVLKGELDLEQLYTKLFNIHGPVIVLGPVAKALSEVEEKWLDFMKEKYGAEGNFDGHDKKFHVWLEARIKQAMAKHA
jgi:hypothetical protein